MDHDTKPTDLGLNRTGTATAPARSKEMLEGATAERPTLGADGAALARERAALSKDAPPVGTVPVPTSLEGMAKSALKAVQGEKATVLIDKLGARLAFERAGVRLYEAVIAKVRCHRSSSASRSNPSEERVPPAAPAKAQPDRSRVPQRSGRLLGRNSGWGSIAPALPGWK